MVKISGVFKRFDETEVLKNINLKFLPGEFNCLLGPTGCGKTTLLRIIAGLLKPDLGVVKIDKPTISMIFQQQTLFPWRNALSNVCLPLEFMGYPKKERIEMAYRRLEEVGMVDQARKKVFHLSGGMQQRVQIARALVSNPSVLLADEPFGALDEKTRYNLQRQIRDVATRNNMSVIFVTHNVSEAIYLGDRIVVIGNHRVKADYDLTEPHPRNRISEWFSDRIIEVRQVFENLIISNEANDEIENVERDDFKTVKMDVQNEDE
jgi:NitT/TauT family transport system ATP-binding protein